MKTNNLHLLDLKDLAQRLGLAPQTIRNQLCSGTFPLPPRRLGRAIRWRSDEVDKFIRSLPT